MPTHEEEQRQQHIYQMHIFIDIYCIPSWLFCSFKALGGSPQFNRFTNVIRNLPKFQLFDRKIKNKKKTTTNKEQERMNK